VLRRFLQQGLDGVPHRPHPGRPVARSITRRSSACQVVGEPTQCWRAECSLDDTPAVDLPGTSHRASCRHRNRAGAPASGGLRLQAADLEPQVQVDRTSRVGKKRLRVEAILAAAASPMPPPIEDLMPDPLLRDELPEDLPWLLRLLPRADVADRAACPRRSASVIGVPPSACGSTRSETLRTAPPAHLRRQKPSAAIFDAKRLVGQAADGHNGAVAGQAAQPGLDLRAVAEDADFEIVAHAFVRRADTAELT
jgi:hypothetical protein